jgi:aminomethyltransferase
MKRTPLYERHIEAGAKMVEFGGWEMPVRYEGVIKEHAAVRNRAGLFDVSHMGEIAVEGTGARAFVDRVVTNDVSELKNGEIVYALLLNESGGTIDDLLVYCTGRDTFMLVVNASNIDKDFDWIASQKGEEDVSVKNISDEYSLLALQGPESAGIIEKIFPDAGGIKYYNFAQADFMGEKIILSRTGYTGEDGFEIYLKQNAVDLWDRLLATKGGLAASPCGIAARDLLRIEAGYPLYGHELTDEIDPATAGLKWAVKKGEASFIGKEGFAGKKPDKKRIGFLMEGRAVPREGYPIFIEGNEAGSVTSGTFSPTLQKPIGIGYIARQKEGFPKIGKMIEIEIRGKLFEAALSKIPFITVRTFSG